MIICGVLTANMMYVAATDWIIQRQTVINHHPTDHTAWRHAARHAISHQICTNCDATCLNKKLHYGRGIRDALVTIETTVPGLSCMWHYLRDPTFRRFHTIPECDWHTHTLRETDRRTDRHTTTACTALSKSARMSVSVSVPWNSSLS